MRIDDAFYFAGMNVGGKAGLHAADVLADVPWGIVIRTDEDQLTLDVFDLDGLLLGDGMRGLGIVKDLSGSDHVSCPLGFICHHLVVLWMRVAEGHKGQGLAMIGEKRFAGHGPLLAAVLIAQHGNDGAVRALLAGPIGTVKAIGHDVKVKMLHEEMSPSHFAR